MDDAHAYHAKELANHAILIEEVGTEEAFRRLYRLVVGEEVPYSIETILRRRELEFRQTQAVSQHVLGESYGLFVRDQD